MSKKAKYFEFGFPVTDLCLGTPQHLGDLLVHAIVYQYPDGSLHTVDGKVDVDVDVIIWDKTNIRKLLQVLAEDTFAEITEAAREHGQLKFELTEPLTA